MANLPLLLVADGPSALGVDSYQWVSIAMLVLIGIFVWKKVPGLITGGLDNKIAEIKNQLDEAKELRSEAEKLRDEYAAKIAGAEKDAETMMEGAQREAEAILEKAQADSEAMVARRKRMAEDKYRGVPIVLRVGIAVFLKSDKGAFDFWVAPENVKQGVLPLPHSKP